MQSQRPFVANKQQPINNTYTKESLLGKTMPMNLEAEKSVLGGVLMDDACFHLLEQHLQPEDFYVPAHQVIFKHMLMLMVGCKRIDIIELQDSLQKTSELIGVGEVAYLVELQENIPTFGLIEQHVQIIKAKSVLRNLISSS